MLVPARRSTALHVALGLLVSLLVCGLASSLTAPSASAIVGGYPARGDEDEVVPEQVSDAAASIAYDGVYQCSGILVAPDRILTAAHCGRGPGPDGLPAPEQRSVLSGYSVTVNGQTYRVVAVSEKDGYVAPVAYNDVMVMVLDRPVPEVAPVATGPVPASGRLIHLSWGATSGLDLQGGGATLTYIRCRTLTAEQYNERLGRAMPSYALTTLCPVGSVVPGDSGSPVLTVDSDGRARVVGVLSAGSAMGDDVSDGFATFRSVRLDDPGVAEWLRTKLTDPAAQDQPTTVQGPSLPRPRVRSCCPVM